MSTRYRSALLIIAIFLILPSAGRAQATPSDIKLLTQNTGWAIAGGRLYSTTNGGSSWTDVTP
jgi:photosystem II stability/assembly factor-like uncharacterized protein